MLFQIVPLRVGDVEGAAFPETGTPLVFLMFLVLGGRDPIVVDTGTPTVAQMMARQAVALRRPPEEEPLAALERWGVAASDVKTIIQTHLHWDHAGGAHLFPDADIVIQDAELRYAVNPTMGDRAVFDLVPGAVPNWLTDIPRMRCVDGDVQLGPGLRVLLTPGHTPGHQALLIDTAAGPHVITGDTLPSYRHWAGDGTQRHIYGPHTDVVAYEGSLARLEGLEAAGTVLIPSHEGQIAGLRFG